MARKVSMLLLLAFVVISCAVGAEIQMLDVPKTATESTFRKTSSKKSSSADTGTVQLLDIPKAGEAATTKVMKKSAAAAEGTVQMLDIPKAEAATTTTTTSRFSKKSSAATDGTVQMLDVPKAEAAAPAATTTTSSRLSILKPLSNLFGSGDTTTSTSVPKPAAGASAGAVQFMEPAATTATTATTKAAAGTVQLLDTDAVTTKTSSSTTAVTAKPQFVDMTPATTADTNTLVGASAAAKRTSYLRKSDAAAAADSDAAVTSIKTKSAFASGAYSDVNDVLNKKIQQTSKALDASESLESSLKLADLLAKLTEALNNLSGK